MSKRKLNHANVFQSLFGDLDSSSHDIRELPLSAIDANPHQPRRHFDEEGLKQLAESIAAHGVLEPILVRPVNNRYQLIVGERRTRAARLAGLQTIPALVKELQDDDVIEIVLIENLQRNDLNPLEETDAVLKLLCYKLGQNEDAVREALKQIYDQARGRVGNTGISNEEAEVIHEVFARLGKFSATSFYSNRLPILDLPSDLLEAVRAGHLEYTKARLLSQVRDDALRQELLRRTVEEHLSRDQLKAIILEQLHKVTPPVQMRLTTIKRNLNLRRLQKLSADQRNRVEALLSELEALLEA